jgi:hypothetical protein
MSSGGVNSTSYVTPEGSVNALSAAGSPAFGDGWEHMVTPRLAVMILMRRFSAGSCIDSSLS